MRDKVLMFTDLVESTLLVQRLGDAEATRILGEHDRRSRDLLRRHGGREVDRSDGFFLLFGTVGEAAAFASDYHAENARLGLLARVGVHVGSVVTRKNPREHVARGAKSFEVEGLAKPLAARVMGLARGGQTLLTAPAKTALGRGGQMPEHLVAHGHYRLKGVSEPIEIFEIGSGGPSLCEAPADTDKAYRVIPRLDGIGWQPVREVVHNLPRERDGFVGRADDLSAISGALEGGARLLTLLGPGGIGKTRLAKRFAGLVIGDFPGGVYFCDLSDVHSRDGAFFVVANALDVQIGKGDHGAQLGHAIAARGPCLLILDNFEQIVASSAQSVDRWLDQAPNAVFIVSSRERLRLAGEVVLPLAPLDLHAEAIDLFFARSRLHRPDLTVTAVNRPIAEQIVTLLDGFPLAIELAAARTSVMSLPQLRERLADRFQLLSASRANAGRQGALRNTIDWSWNLLMPWEQVALAQSTIFEGSFTLEAAEAVLDVTGWADAPATSEIVRSLVDKSLLRQSMSAEPSPDDSEELSFGMFISIHEYATEKRASLSQEMQREIEERHGAFFSAAGAEHRVVALSRHGGIARRRALARDLDNLVVACKRAVGGRRAVQAVGAFRAACEVFAQRGPFEVAVRLGAEVDALHIEDPSMHAAALAAMAQAQLSIGNADDADATLGRALALARASGDTERESYVRGRIGNAHRLQGRMAEATRSFEVAIGLRADADRSSIDGVLLAEIGIVYRQTGFNAKAHACFEQALEIDRRVGDVEAESKVLNNLANLHIEQGRHDLAISLFGESLGLARDLGSHRHEGLVLGNLATTYLELGRLEEAAELFEQALQVHRTTGERFEQGNLLNNLGSLKERLGRFDEARELYVSALEIAREVGSRPNEAMAIAYLGELERHRGRFHESLVLYREALQLHRAVGHRRMEAAILARLGALHAQAGRLTEARALFDEAEPIMVELGDKLELLSISGFRGQLELAEGALGAATEMLARADRLATELKLLPNSPALEDLNAFRRALEQAQAAGA